MSLSIVYHITSLADLLDAWRIVAQCPAHVYFLLDNDIDASATSGWHSGQGFPPFGWTTTSPSESYHYMSFRGSFDGRGHTIYGLHMNWPGSATDKTVGLFNRLISANVRNVRLEDCTIIGHNYTGVLAGMAIRSHISCIHIEGCEVTGNEYVGGAIGLAQAESINSSTPFWDHELRDRHLPIAESLTVSNTTVTGAEGAQYVGEVFGHHENIRIRDATPPAVKGTVWLEASPEEPAKFAYIDEDGIKRAIEGVLP